MVYGEWVMAQYKVSEHCLVFKDSCEILEGDPNRDSVREA